MKESLVKNGEGITFYVAECSEFTEQKQAWEHLTIEEAIEKYKNLPQETQNLGAGIGFVLHKNELYNDMHIPIITGTLIDADTIFNMKKGIFDYSQAISYDETLETFNNLKDAAIKLACEIPNAEIIGDINNIHDLLLRKCENEIIDYKEQYLHGFGAIAWDKSYEIMSMKEIYTSFTLSHATDFKKNEFNAMMSSKSLLKEMYDDWCSFDDSLSEEIKSSILDSANKMSKAKENKNHKPKKVRL